jgi:hypothetical protein
MAKEDKKRKKKSATARGAAAPKPAAAPLPSAPVAAPPNAPTEAPYVAAAPAGACTPAPEPPDEVQKLFEQIQALSPDKVEKLAALIAKEKAKRSARLRKEQIDAEQDQLRQRWDELAQEDARLDEILKS